LSEETTVMKAIGVMAPVPWLKMNAGVGMHFSSPQRAEYMPISPRLRGKRR
jgi:hypothetical protein